MTEMTEHAGYHLIAGLPSREAAPTFAAFNPRTRQEGARIYAEATAAEIDRAAAAARAAFAQTRAYPATRLADFLDAVAGEIDALGDALIAAADAETALGTPRLTGERARTTGQLRAFAALLREGSYVEAIIDRAQPDRQPAPRPDLRRMRVPLGVVAVFGASNFPLAFSVAGGDSASAWAAGCPVIVKAHPGHPHTSALTAGAVMRAAAACAFPPGFFSLVHGETPEVGQALAAHPAIDAIGFTGSHRAGRALFDTAARRPRPIPVYAEMGSVNPVVITEGALLARAGVLADGLAASAVLGAGQFCTNPGLVFLTASAAAEAFLADYTAKMTAKTPGVLLNRAVEHGLERAVAETRAAGVAVQVGGAFASEGCFAHTVMTADGAAFLRESDRLQTEMFGPVTLIVVCADEAERVAALGRLHGQLTATVHAEADEADAAAPILAVLAEKAGRVLWNGFPTGVEVVYAQMHGGPYPATTAPATTSVGMTAIARFMRPVAFQNWPDALLPPALQEANPLGITRLVDGVVVARL
jgi:NADP-dependent aldehyde dehydrogenase